MTKKICLLIICSTLIVGCGPTNQVITPIKYQEEIEIKSSKTAYVYWAPGRCVAGAKPEQNVEISSNHDGGLAGLVATTVVATIAHQHRKNNPSQYSHQYSKADQTVFITSLRDALLKQNVFKDVVLTTNLSEVKSKDVLIRVYFETARANKFGDITLTVKLTITGGNKPKFEKTYFAQSDDPKARTFLDSKMNASKQLLEDIIKGIERWHKKEKL